MSKRLKEDQVTLLISLVPYLKAMHGRALVSEAAAHFDATPEEIVDAVRTIAVSGAPGDTGNYDALELFDIDWDALGEGVDNDDNPVPVPGGEREIVVTHFAALEEAPVLSNREAAAIMAGLQVLRSLPGSIDPEAVDALLEKLKPGGASESPVVIGARDADATLAVVRRAAEARHRLTFLYRSPDSPEAERVVDPIRLESLGDDWYLRAWCHDREAERNFRLDRMRDARDTGEAAAAHAPERSLRLFTAGPDDPVVVLDVASSAAPLIREFLDEGAKLPAPDAGGRLRVEVRAAGWSRIVRLAAGSAGVVRVVAPAEARRAVAEWAHHGLAGYEDRPAVDAGSPADEAPPAQTA